MHYLIDLREVRQLYLLGPFRGLVVVTSTVLLQKIEEETFEWGESVVVRLGRCGTEVWHEAVLLRVRPPVVGLLDVKVVGGLVL